MKMNPGRGDERFVAEKLFEFFQHSHQAALLETVQAIAKHVGLSEITGIPVEEFYHRRAARLPNNLLLITQTPFPRWPRR